MSKISKQGDKTLDIYKNKTNLLTAKGGQTNKARGGRNDATDQLVM